MLTILSAMMSLLRDMGDQPVQETDTETLWLRDPLTHPVLAAMDQRQLADLPAAVLRARLRC